MVALACFGQKEEEDAEAERGGERQLDACGDASVTAGISLGRGEHNPDEGQRHPQQRETPRPLAAALGFGVFFLFLAKASEGNHALAATFMLRLTTVPLVLLAMLALRQPLRVPRRHLRWIVLIGVLDSGANALYALATNHGLLSLVSVLSSLYPLTTVLLAQALLHEHVSRHQRLGIVAALAGVVLISAA
jgi:drug/metabolite transporter (DMT)-like permease